MTRIRTFIIDDEAPARRELRFLLGQLEMVEVVGEGGNPSEGLQGVRDTHPDLVFLDIQLPGLTGIELSQVIAGLPKPPLVVFATAFQNFAVEAFNQDACDYLLKPVTLERIQKAVDKAARLLAQRSVAAVDPEPVDPKWIAVRSDNGVIPLAPEKIIFVVAAAGETVIHTKEAKYSAGYTLQSLQEKLQLFRFFRAHRHSLVNLNYVSEIIPWFNGSSKLIMADRGKTEVLVSRYHMRELKRHLISRK